MTILIITPPTAREADYHVWSDVVSCDDFFVTLRNGKRYRKPLCAKVELLSVLDAPTDANYDTWVAFTHPLLDDFCNREGIERGFHCFRINKDRFNSLDLDTHI